MSGRIFKVKKVKGGETLGEKLKKARLERGLSLAEISNKINVQEKYLEFIEKSRYDKMPAEVYARGFLTSYADFLGANEKKVMELYKREKKISGDDNKKESEIDLNKKRGRFFVLTPRVFKIFFILLLVGGIITYLWYQVNVFSSSPILTVTDPSWDKTINDTKILVSGMTDPDMDLMINGQKVFVDMEGRFREDVSLQEGINNLRIVASNSMGKESVIERKVRVDLSGQSGATEGLLNENEVVPIDGMELEVRVNEKATWVSVETDGESAYSGTMLPDTQQKFRARDRITISSGKAEATQVILNGKDMGILGESGDAVRDMEFTKDMVDNSG